MCVAADAQQKRPCLFGCVTRAKGAFGLGSAGWGCCFPLTSRLCLAKGPDAFEA